MIDLIFFVGSILGVSAMVYLNHRLKVWTPARIESLDEARQRLDVDSVGFHAGPGVVAPDGQAALVEDAGADRIGLLAARGDNVVIRYLDAGSVRAAKMVDDGLNIVLRDFTFAPVRMRFDDSAEARVWADKLNSMQA